MADEITNLTHPDPADTWPEPDNELPLSSHFDEPTPVLPSGLGADFSIVDAFRQELQEAQDNQTVFIRVQGFEKIGLQIKYRMQESGKELADLERNVERQTKEKWQRNLLTAMDTMIILCQGLYVQPEGVEEPVMLDPQETGEPCMFDHRLAEIMNMGVNDNQTARSVVRKLFAGNDVALMSHAQRLSLWLQNTKADVNEGLWESGE